MVVPNSVALIERAPHPKEGRKLVDYLLSRRAEQRLTDAGWIQVSVRGPVAGDCLNAGAVKMMSVSATDVAAQVDLARKELSELFAK